MQMFELKSFEVCPKTGITSFDMRWDLGNGLKSDQGNFVDRRDAERYIISCKLSYIKIMFSKYVMHSRVLFETGHHDFYRKESKIASLDRCSKYNQWFDGKSLEAICKVILVLEEDLRRILPSPGNPSHSSSESKIMDMIVFCKKEMLNYPQTKNQSKITAQ